MEGEVSECVYNSNSNSECMILCQYHTNLVNQEWPGDRTRLLVH